jgi:predicted dehydrogenase
LQRNPSGTLILRDAKGRETTATLPDRFDLRLYSAEIQHFSRCILEGTAPRADAGHGTWNLQVILAAYESARTGRAVSVVPS